MRMSFFNISLLMLFGPACGFLALLVADRAPRNPFLNLFWVKVFLGQPNNNTYFLFLLRTSFKFKVIFWVFFSVKPIIKYHFIHCYPPHFGGVTIYNGKITIDRSLNLYKSGKKLLKTDINGHGRSLTVKDDEKLWDNGERRWVTVAKNGNGTVTGR